MFPLDGWVYALILSLHVVVIAAADEKPCTAHDGDRFYDLTPLQSSQDYKFASPDGQEFVINVCKSVSYDTWNVGVEHPENIAGVTRKERGDFSIGEVNTTLLIRDKHPLLVLTEGSICPHAERMHAMTAVRFICDTSVFGSGSPRLVAQLPPDDASACAFFLEWRTHYACPSGEATGFWGGLVVALSIIAIIGLMLYVVGGTLYNRYVLQLRGFDQLPRISIFSFTDTLDYLQGFCDRFSGSRAHSRHDTSRSWSGRGGMAPRDFERLPVLPEEEEAMVGGGDENGYSSHEEEGVGASGRPVSAEQPQAKAGDTPGTIRL
ncbi:mannose 6-phosphate receptor domain-containing protein [Artomyces pyxidatus]|uniref:Mannose 6-phosphate receptor domain-containing protein n=1 Tax=Artomyces pyxidatus TaxID=48021 RepID=A0ACB8SU33_9AGAM|nr:mannose 6-phosphate receptor domain-containing protein [Artomyces pyxidatus]